MTKRFTENQLGQVYLGMYEDYTFYQKNGYPVQAIHESISAKLFYSLNDPTSSLCGLSEAEKNRVWAVYYAFINSTLSFQRQLPNETQQKQFWNSFDRKKQPVVVIDNTRKYHYCAHNTLLDWLLLDSFLNSFNRPRVHYGHHRSSHTHRHKEEKNKGELICYLIVLALMTFAVAASLIALYYLLKECLDSVERFIFNEGQLKAAISLSSIVGGAAAGALFGTFIASMPIMMLGIAAGVSNPVGLAITGIVCITIISAAISCGITNWIQNKAIKHQNKDALDARDPERYALSEKEEANLIKKGYDIYTVKIAIVALRKEIGEKGVPSLLNRLFTTKGGEKQENLDSIRKIKRGELGSIKVGNMEFNFRTPNLYAPVTNAYNWQQDKASVYAANPIKQSERFFPQQQTTPPATFLPQYTEQPNVMLDTTPSAPPSDEQTNTSNLYPSLAGYYNYQP
ncbi:Uncharacterised protein [Legionella busanensis]|uniref:Uncharacterized protein n=1 Tax=Legionella busanensis TaxID=190655 RepID=A0A378JNJ5_9GAMM|nr:hypothetical protein [Legionella busanensis]STX52281.1 Uncharacterised protein [Legionella busanensis]